MNKTRLFAAFACVSALIACNNETSMPEPSFGSVVISMSANVNNVLGRANVSSFPNAIGETAQVTVIARKSSVADWSSLYINNAIADVGASVSGYSLKWAEGHEQFWPSNGDELTFAAYSPVAVGGSGVTLNVALGDETPDVLAALTKDGTNPITGTKSGSGQTPSSINFIFEHVLSQLQVKVKNQSSDVMITKVEVVVAKNHCVKVYDIPSRTWTPGSAPTLDKKYAFSKPLGFGSNGVEVVNADPLLLFPGTQSSVTIVLYRGSNVFASRRIDEFVDTEGTPASLVAGKKTILTLTVVDNDLADMTAGVDDWEDLGEFDTIV